MDSLAGSPKYRRLQARGPELGRHTRTTTPTPAFAFPEQDDEGLSLTRRANFSLDNRVLLGAAAPEVATWEDIAKERSVSRGLLL